jgi:hypothetical protein
MTQFRSGAPVKGWVVGELPDRDGDPGLDCLAIVIAGGAAAHNVHY